MRVPTLVAVVSCLLVSGCATAAPADPDLAAGPGSAAASPEASASPTASPAPSPTPSPTPQPFIAPAAVSANRWACEALLDAVTLDEYAAAGFVFSEDFADRVVAEGWTLGKFVEYGGVACEWGVPQSGDYVRYGQSPITAEDAAAEVARLVAEGYPREAAYGGDLYCQLNDEEPPREDCFLFVDGEWFAGGRSLIEIMRAQTGLESK